MSTGQGLRPVPRIASTMRNRIPTTLEMTAEELQQIKYEVENEAFARGTKDGYERGLEEGFCNGFEKGFENGYKAKGKNEHA